MGYCFSSSPHSPSPALKRTLYLFSVGWTEERGFFKIWQTSDNEPRIFTGRGECSNQSPTIGQFSKYRGASKNVWVMKNLSYEKFELWVMLSLCFSHVATIASPFGSSVFPFLAKLSKICEIFFSCEKKTMKLSLLHNNVNTSSHWKGNLMALTVTKRDMPANYHYPGRDHETWFELSKFSSNPRSS